MVPSMQKLFDTMPKVFHAGFSSLFLGFSVVQYLAYYISLETLFADIMGRFAVIVAIMLTYMFRLDILAAALGFWGMWKVWEWPLWVALIVTVIFESLSLVIHYGAGHNPATFLQRIWPKKKASSKETNL